MLDEHLMRHLSGIGHQNNGLRTISKEGVYWMTSTPQQGENGYFIDAESAAEMARLMHQDSLTTQGMGGTFPERADFSSIHSILDIACGPGSWILDVAFEHPEIHVVGVDVSRMMIEYAYARALTQGFVNAEFRVMDVLKPLAFPNASFDLVNARFIFGFMPPASWPALMKECARITRNGGIIRLSESEWNITNSLAYETLHSMTTRAMKKANKSFSPDGRNVGITPMLGQFLQDAQCKNIQHMAHAIDLSYGTKAHESLFQNLQAFFKLIEPFLISMEVIDAIEFDALYTQMLAEIQLNTFRGVSFILTVWGETQKNA
jgi:ubiquinone/menaquinone biosynthesis C-methylase UbiE